MIASQAEVRVLLGLASSITDEDRALIELLSPMAKSAIINDGNWGLGYDPEYFEDRVEWFPQADRTLGGSEDAAGFWDSNANGTKAHWRSSGNRVTDLQLSHLPVRSVREVRVDFAGGFGQKAGTFGEGTVQTVGDQYFIKLDRAGLSLEGVLYSHTGWPIEPGSVKVIYTSGYTSDEFSGRATSESGSTRTGIDASPIKQAFLVTLVKMFRTFKSQRLATGALAPSALSGESLGDYSWTGDGASAAALTGFTQAVPPEAGMLLQRFRHYGLMLI
jgi:hypothetical protein